jgi:hypothetical protein
MDNVLAPEQLFYVVPMPLSLGSEECRKPRFESGSKIVGEFMRLGQAPDNLGCSKAD